MKIRLLLVFYCFCTLASAQKSFPEGSWRAELQLNDSTILPFTFNVFGHSVEFINATERIVTDELTVVGDSAIIHMPFFDSEFRVKLMQEEASGSFINHSRKSNQVIPVRFYHNESYRFSDKPEKTTKDVSGRWQIHFDGEDPSTSMGIAILHQDVNHVTGTILTPTGDHRYLDGEINGNRLWLSAFDGSHAFLHTALVRNDSLLFGQFYSGTHWHDTWTGWRNDKASLPDAESLSFFKPTYNRLDFRFPDSTGKMVSLSDPEFNNKVVIVQLMGSWCPNCMDETIFLTSFYSRYKERGVEIIALDYERIADTSAIWKNISRLKKQMDISYPILYAGSSDRKAREKTLPMLSAIMALPTTIIIDKRGKVRKIHTGFSGPASGAEYEQYTDNFKDFIDKLLSE